MKTVPGCSITLLIASRLDHVSLIRAALGGILLDSNVAEHDVFLLQLAVSEIVSNAIEHGYRGEITHSVEVSVSPHQDELRIDIADDASAMPFESIERILDEQTSPPEVDTAWTSRGHGLQIVRSAIDSLEFRRAGDRNLVTLRKRLSMA